MRPLGHVVASPHRRVPLQPPDISIAGTKERMRIMHPLPTRLSYTTHVDADARGVGGVGEEGGRCGGGGGAQEAKNADKKEREEKQKKNKTKNKQE
eukprot:65502-Rhodomonas_salina.1